ncbi:hypothetical protein M407DRAFT_17228 [Tulasnella calospora MUT 4182]|uniref:Major facilitator superfamily (MFS) profile domain-containing protein n=1 Tax=Tulasnella calospora MUT 4182 TaxID=1051891 RepID=A0A0C3QM40_9AGAM|nr:hypothetical protein M407DRAFT_17228 [Tulasnella calospora MUT 4182]
MATPIDEESRPLLAQTQLVPTYHGLNSTSSTSPSGVSTPVEQPGHQPLNKPTTRELVWILVALWSAVFLGALDTTIVATLLTSIGSYFNRAHQSSYLGSAYLLSVCCFTPLYGRLSDIMGRKHAMLLAMTLFTVGTLLCGLATSMNGLIAARAIAGMGGGGVMTVSSITATDLIPLKRRGIYQGLANILFGLGAGLGGPLGGFINDHIGWRWAFLIQVPFLVASMILISIFVNVHLPTQSQTTREKLVRIDYLGSTTLVIGVGSLLLAITLKTAEGFSWDNPWVWGLFTVGTVFSTGFVYVEGWVAKEPIMPLRLLKQRTAFAVAVTNLLISIIAFSMLYNVPIYFTAVQLMSAENAGLHLLPNAVALASGSVGAGLWMRWTGKFLGFTIFSATLCVLSSVLIASWSASSHPLHFWIDIVFSGFGGSSFITTTLIGLIASVGREDIAVATGLSYLFRTTGQVVGVAGSGAILQTLLARNLEERITGPGADEIIRTIRQVWIEHSTTIIPELEPSIRQAAVESYALALQAVFYAQAGIAALALLVSLAIEEHPLPGSHEEHEEHERQRRAKRSQQEPSTSD